MFDFFKYTFDELRGVDMQEKERARLEKLQKEKEDIVVFKKSTKVIVYVFGIFFLVMAVMIVSSMIKRHSTDVLNYVKYGSLTVIDIAAMAGMLLHTKRSEMIGAICVVAFIVLYCATL